MTETDPTPQIQEAKFSTAESLAEQPETKEEEAWHRNMDALEARQAQENQEWDEITNQFGEKANLFKDHYIEFDPELRAPLQDADADEYQAFKTAVESKPLARARLDEALKICRAQNEILAALEKNTPELLAGKLPPDQERALGNEKYVLGSNQSNTRSVQEAVTSLQENGGVPIGHYGLDQRFIMWDAAISQERPDYVRPAISTGYTGDSRIYRNILAVPLDQYYKVDPDPQGHAVYHAKDADTYNIVPADFRIKHDVYGREDLVISSKYIAGFVDEQGNYYPNKNFAKTDRFELEVPGMGSGDA